MYCRNCQNNSVNSNGVCPECGLSQKIKKEPAPYIPYLDVSLRLKNAFLLIEKYKMYSPKGIMMRPQDKNNAPTFSEKMELFSWMTFFFGPLYYLFLGMWRKGLVLLAINIILGSAFELWTIYILSIMGIDILLIIQIFYFTNIAFLITLHIIFAKTAFYDRYRTIIKKEAFWW
ncbi:DUF2628 domain-containing protein [Desulfovibrio litoralis]|uniref:DUF2628 domain-containing protein n=1 Tax=Desulfovibrio litoralis DSM 11393 TaxID=1121455 RepID=A0A1M7TF18_9BACT|nr:DUF2628 domain-containing protein [Desulfovibrio litoralis]SHN69305.1 Protein of unknown function [Desulfovibrio litoralis DSM 11393]